MMKWILAFAATLAWTAPASAADKVVLMLNWYVYGEHAPFYYGKAKGIYAAENIDLEIQEGRGSAATTQAVAAKTADFGYVDVPTMMRAAVKGAPVVDRGRRCPDQAERRDQRTGGSSARLRHGPVDEDQG